MLTGTSSKKSLMPQKRTTVDGECFARCASIFDKTSLHVQPPTATLAALEVNWVDVSHPSIVESPANMILFDGDGGGDGGEPVQVLHEPSTGRSKASLADGLQIMLEPSAPESGRIGYRDGEGEETREAC